MLANLLDNAIRHTPRGAHIEVSLVNHGSQLVASVADDGSGVPPAERERIFRRFYRAEGSISTAGTGLGLSLVAAVAELHGMKFSATDNAPGLRMTLTFERGGTQHKATAPAGFASHRSRPGARGTRNCAASTGTGRNGSAAKLGNALPCKCTALARTRVREPARSIEKHASQAPRVSGSIRIDNLRVAEPTQTTCWIEARTDRARQATIN